MLRAPDGRCLFLQRTRGAFPYTWGLPGGHREPGEDADETALRELEEECGYTHDGETQPLHETDTYTTLLADVPQAFEPRLNDEHVDYQWAWPHMPPEPLHPALEAMIAEVGPDTMVEGCSFAGAMDSDILAFDRGTVRRKDKDGRLHIELTNISKANICPYRGHEIPGWQELRLNADQVYNLLRDPEELAKAAPTFQNLPLLSKHVPVNAEAHRPDLVIGSVGTDASFQAPYLRNSLVVWAADAIKAIELADEDPAHPEAMKELSSAYYYKADMTPGTAADGTRYDGVMRDIVGNHVALVKDGRAGDDVVVGDSAMDSERGAADRTAMDSKETTMSKTVLTRKGALLQGAVHAFLLPMLAQDAQIDLTPALKGVGPKNYKARKPTIVTAVGKATEGKLAQDATLDGLLGLLDAMDDVMPMEPVEDDEPDFLKDGGAEDEDPSAKVMEFLKDKLSSDDCAAVKSLLSPPSAQDEEDDEKKEPAAEDEEDDESKTPAEDEDEDGKKDPPSAEDEEEDEMVTKAAMDSAIAAATKTATAKALQHQRDIRAAEVAVRPWVGEIVAQDSAEGVYKTALKALGVDVAGVHSSALPAILKAQPLPDARAKRQSTVAMDSAGVKSFHERFPGTDRIATA